MRPDLHTLNPHLTNLEIPGHGREGLHEETSSRRSMPGVRVDLRWASTDARKAITGIRARVPRGPVLERYGSNLYGPPTARSRSTLGAAPRIPLAHSMGV